MSDSLIMSLPVVRKSDGKEVPWKTLLLGAERCFEPPASADPELQELLLEDLYWSMAVVPNQRVQLCLQCSILERGGLCERLTNAMLTGQLAGPGAFAKACQLLNEVQRNLGLRRHSIVSDPHILGHGGHAAPQTYQAAVVSFWKRSPMMLTATMRGLGAVLGDDSRPVFGGTASFLLSVFHFLGSTCDLAGIELGTTPYHALMEGESLRLLAVGIRAGGDVFRKAVDLLYNCSSYGGPRSSLVDLDELRLVNFAVQQLRNCSTEAQDFQVDWTCAALKLASLLPATQPAAVNNAVANTVRIILGMESDLDIGTRYSRPDRDFDLSYDMAHKVWEEAFHTLAALFITSGNNAIEAANHAGASTPEFKEIAEDVDGSAVVLERLHAAAVAAADAAMAALLLEEESERSAAAKPRKSKKKSKPRSASTSAGPEVASPPTAAASPAAAPPAAAPPPPTPPPPAAVPAPACAPPPATAAAAVPSPRAPAAAPPPLPAYLTAPRAAAAPPAPPPVAPLLPPSAPALPSPAAPAVATKECCVCLDDVAAADLHLLFPCGHRCVCEACAATVMAADPAARRCPKCRAAVVGAARVYEE